MPRATPTQLPLPLITALPYMGDERTCHHWDLSPYMVDPDGDLQYEMRLFQLQRMREAHTHAQ